MKARKFFWKRFSLRSLLVILTVFCLSMGWFIFRVEQQKKSARWVQQNGGQTFYVEEGLARWLPAESIEKLVGVDFVSSAHSVHGLEVNQFDLSDLAGFTRLKSIQLAGQGAKLRNQDLDVFGQFTELRGFRLYSSNVDDLTPLERNRKLREIWLDNAPISDLTLIPNLQNLESLVVSSTKVKDIRALATAHRLNHLSLENTPVDDLQALSSLGNLKSLWLGMTAIKDLAPLESLVNLEKLHLNDTNPENIYPLFKLKKLKLLDLRRVQIDEETLLNLYVELPKCKILIK